jgi:hypothetical protein
MHRAERRRSVRRIFRRRRGMRRPIARVALSERHSRLRARARVDDRLPSVSRREEHDHRWDPTTQRIVIPPVTTPFPWGQDLGLGDASLVASDGEHAFVWGCARPGMFLEQGCELARLDANDDVELFSAQGTWIASTDAARGAVLFGSGTFTSSVVPEPGGGLRHVFIGDFGNTIQSHVAGGVTGPWIQGSNVAACDLPLSDDPHSFCGGPIAHGELSDPTRPGEMAITYGVGSSANATGTPDDYWPRLIWSQ